MTTDTVMKKVNVSEFKAVCLRLLEDDSGLFPDEAFTGAAFYQKVEEGYSPQAEINSQSAGTCVFCQILGQPLPLIKNAQYRSEERRVGKECRSRWSAEDLKTFH